MIRKHQTGFTLVEMAIVLAILGIVLGGLFAGTSALRETAKFKEDQQKLQDIKAALLSYVAVNNYLPCPDTTGDGIENPSDLLQPQCDATAGTLPFISLGTHSANAYGLPFSYYINAEANNTNNVIDPSLSASYFGRTDCNQNTANRANAPCFKKDTPPTISITGTGNFDISNGSSNIAEDVPLVVISHGQNGCNSVTGREEDNCTNNTRTYYQVQQNREAPNAFDDVLIWLSSLEIKAATPQILGINYTDTGETDNGSSPDWGDYSPTVDLENTDLLDDATNYGNLNSNTSRTITDSNAILGNLNSSSELVLVGNTVISTGNLNSSGTIKLTGGNNIIQTNSLNSNGEIYEVNGANGNNAIRINGNMNSNAEIALNNGNNRIYIGGQINSGATISFGSGTNILYIIGSINPSQPIEIDGGTLYINNNIPTSKVNLLNGATVNYCNDLNMDCP